MVYGAKTVLPTDIEYGALRVKLYTSKKNESNPKDMLDQLDEARDVDSCGRHGTNRHYKGTIAATFEKGPCKWET
jgi:hypothetical protein